MSRVDSPREYSARILSSNPSNRRWRLRTIFGSKLPSRSRGRVDLDLPVLGDQRLRGRCRCACSRRRRAAPGAAHSRHGRSARPPSRAPPGAWSARANSPPGPAISSSVLAPASSSSITSLLIRRSDGIPRACRTRRRPAARSTASSTSPGGSAGGSAAGAPRRGCPAPISARSRSLRSSPGNPGAIPNPRASSSRVALQHAAALQRSASRSRRHERSLSLRPC